MKQDSTDGTSTWETISGWLRWRRIPTREDQRKRRHRQYRFLASSVSLVPTIMVFVMSLFFDITPVDRWRFVCFSTATVGLVLCFGCWQAASSRIRIVANLLNRFEAGRYETQIQRFRDRRDEELLRRAKYALCTFVSGICWIFVACSQLAYMADPNVSIYPEWTAICAGMNLALAFWKIWDFSSGIPELEESYSAMVEDVAQAD